MIEMMNGKITVSSEVEKGSIFNIILENVEVASVEALKSRQEKYIDFDSIVFEKSTILIIDDIDFNRELIKGFLEDYDFSLPEAEDGQEAIEKIKQHKPDLIMLDMKMPVMDGYEVANILNKDEQLKDIPIIVVTASAMKRNEEIISKFCDAYLKKPISKTDLILEIMKFLPHSIKEEISADIAESAPEQINTEFSLETLKNLPELLKILKEKQIYCQELSELMAIDEIEKFAEKMKKLGYKYEYQPLINWSEDLYLSAQAFDMEKIQNSFLKFSLDSVPKN
ncbi:hypothetical protein GMMP1_360063 [Candidatus Magnetomoraceae bacterium gMMP-1]